MPRKLLNVAQAAAALDAPLGSLGDESAPSAMAGCAFEAKLAIKGQEPNRQGLRGNADIAFAENDPIFGSGRIERLEFHEGLPLARNGQSSAPGTGSPGRLLPHGCPRAVTEVTPRQNAETQGWSPGSIG
jgi:hypothetical protein